MEIVLVALFGLLLGSFFNVLICRLPNKESILFPPSHCPACKSPIRPWHNIPVLSYVLLRGKCRSCKKPISLLYPIIELGTSIASVGIWLLFSRDGIPTALPDIVHLIALSLFLLIIIPISIIDFKHFIIPDALSLFFLLAGILASLLPGSITPLQSLLGLLAGGGSLYAIGWVGALILKKEAMGGGDVKLMAAAGAFIGAQNALLAIIFGAMLGAIYGITIIVIKKTPSSRQIPFGPFLGAGIWIALFAGQFILATYLQLINFHST